MSIVFHIMKEELARLNEAERVYRKSVQSALQGAPRIKRIGNNSYLYLERRDGGKVVYRYVGPAAAEKALAVLDAVKRRRKDMASLKKVRADLRDVRKVLRGKLDSKA
jgi:hypothetical protein